MSAGNHDGSDKEDGADVHCCSLLSCINDAGGSRFGMIKLRDPFGGQEAYDCGGWEHGGPNWDQYPSVYDACGRPSTPDDGIFWMEKNDFFKNFRVIYLC